MTQGPGRPPPDADDPAERLAQFEQARGLEHDALIPGYDEGDEDLDAVDDPAERLAQFEQARGLEHDALIPGYDEGDEDLDAADDLDDEDDADRRAEPEGGTADRDA